MNQCNFIGNLGRDPEQKFTGSGTAVCEFSVAVNGKPKKGDDGQYEQTTEWINVKCFGKLAENCTQYLAKGRKVAVTAMVQTRSWEDKNSGEKKYKTEFIADHVEFLSPREGAGERSGESRESGASKPRSTAANSSRPKSQRPADRDEWDGQDGDGSEQDVPF